MLRVGHLTEFISRRNSDFHKERKRTKKKEKLGRRGLWKLPQLWKSIKVAFGDFFLMISTSCCEKAYARTASAFSQLRTGPTAVNLSTHFQEAAVHLKHAVFWS